MDEWKKPSEETVSVENIQSLKKLFDKKKKVEIETREGKTAIPYPLCTHRVSYIHTHSHMHASMCTHTYPYTFTAHLCTQRHCTLKHLYNLKSQILDIITTQIKSYLFMEMYKKQLVI